MKILCGERRVGAGQYSAIMLTFFVATVLWTPALRGQEQNGGSANAQVTPAATVESEAFQAVLKRLAELEAEVKALRAEREARTQAPASQPSTAAPAETSVQPATPAVAENAANPETQPKYARLRIRGYSDFGWSTTDVHGETNSFALGDFNLLITSQISAKTSIVSELIAEASSENNEFKVEVERVLFKYAANDYFNIGFGRYYTSIGYYSAAYPHSSWLQTAVDRPALFDFEDDGGILPIHNIGFTINGRIPSGSLGLSYLAELGNGRAFRFTENSPVQNKIDENNGKSFNVGLIAKPSGVPGLQFGFSAYHDVITPFAAPKVRETILSAHAVYLHNRLEFLNDVVVLRHSVVNSGVTHNSTGFNSQVARQWGRFRPYFRYQYLNVPVSDPIFSSEGRKNGPSVGLRYELNDWSALKMEYDRTLFRNLPAASALETQIAFTF